jgi:hypothetical protein
VCRSVPGLSVHSQRRAVEAARRRLGFAGANTAAGASRRPIGTPGRATAQRRGSRLVTKLRIVGSHPAFFGVHIQPR